MRGNRRSALGLIAALAIGLAGCATETPAAAPSATGGAYPVTVGSVTLAQQPTKIVSLSPTLTEMLFAIGAGKQVTAVDDQSNFPADAPKTDLSGFKPNAEAIAAKNPDLVVLSDNLNEIVAQLTTLKIPVFVAPAAKTVEDSYRQIADLGTLTGHPADAASLVESMKGRMAAALASVQKRAKPLTYFYELSPDLYSATSKTFIGSLFSLAGLTNIADPLDSAATGGYPQLSAEALVKANPDMVFLADTKCCQQTPETVKARAGWAGVTAVAKSQIVGLDDDIASRWGPRVVDLFAAITGAVNKVPA
ncbi:iron complex transport system substrate-binding protein [Allocatelliglobosispora scoriae]|uniref:Iron complex transport system substrate-binding protein n=1 Tax=Allocatelliglobosispora scoriae TaxID=643052 RepID=A0A841BV35_9ACTN|nr:ABC transporter substrate-binding protein [Allocatelliglobosispora scoriae]MBB5870773.1 iron complex transport system substrate-binding protein [Allocatelliglobosispora scoriae]